MNQDLGILLNPDPDTDPDTDPIRVLFLAKHLKLIVELLFCECHLKRFKVPVEASGPVEIIFSP
jgi:hypothetical protein